MLTLNRRFGSSSLTKVVEEDENSEDDEVVGSNKGLGGAEESRVDSESTFFKRFWRNGDEFLRWTLQKEGVGDLSSIVAARRPGTGNSGGDADNVIAGDDMKIENAHTNTKQLNNSNSGNI